MATLLNAYIGRNFEDVVLLEYIPVGSTAYETVANDTVTRAVFKFGDYCVDTDEALDADYISLETNATRVALRLGGISGLAAGLYKGYLTIFDAVNTKGLPWVDFTVHALPWPVWARWPVFLWRLGLSLPGFRLALRFTARRSAAG